MQKLSYWVIVDQLDSGFYEARTPDVPGLRALGTSKAGVVRAMAESIDCFVHACAEAGENPPRAEAWSASDIDSTVNVVSRSEISVFVPSTTGGRRVSDATRGAQLQRATMTTPMNVFVAEGNVEVYLSRLRRTPNAEKRDNLLRLIREEESRMGQSREHFENGQRRVIEGRQRIKKHRRLIARAATMRHAENAAFALETLERTQALLEEWLDALNGRREQTKL